MKLFYFKRTNLFIISSWYHMFWMQYYKKHLYYELQTKSGMLIGSKLANRKGDVAWNNYSIAVRNFLTIDILTLLLEILINILIRAPVNFEVTKMHIYDLPRAPVDFEEREFYGQVSYYFVHELNNELSMLAFVQWIRNPKKLGSNILFFRYFGKIGLLV